MPRRVKEEERVEMIIRGLLKQPDNRRCINCNSLGPQYVCTTFWTFVCTNCSGVHREFNHRVKSVSMAKFNDEEIMSLQAGGNERAKQIYLKTWDPLLKSYPESSNLHRIREFVNSVYVDRKYAGENSSNKLSMAKSENSRNFCEWPSEKPRWGRRDDYLGRSAVERGSNSGMDDLYDHSLFEKSSSSKGGKGLNLKDFLEERIPRNIQEMPRSTSHRSRPTRLEIVDDRFREDGSVKRYERNSVREPGYGSRSPGALRIAAAPPGADDQKAAEGSARGQKAAEATTIRPTGTNEKQNEATNSSSLIDFADAKPEPNQSPAEPQEEKMASDTNNKSISVASPTTQVTAIVPVNSVEFLLFELSAPITPSSAITNTSQMYSGPARLDSTNISNDVQTTKAPEISNSSEEALAIVVMPSDQPLDRENAYHVMQDMQAHQLLHNTISNTLHTASSVASSLNEQGNKSPASDDLRRTKSVPHVQSLQPVNLSPSARREIPEELFASGYPSFTPAVAGWQMHLPHGAGYGMQFHPRAMPLSAYPNPPKPKNPFDTDDDRFQVQAATYPSMPQFQGHLTNMPTSRAPESQPSPYAAALSSQSHMSSYGMNMHLVPGAYMAQVSNSMLLTRPEGNANFGRSDDAFAFLNPIQRGGSGAETFPTAPTSSLSRAGNPFG
ncbi:hypothetical protein C2S53_012557 [Perilla frutescens var. hirtella]|uniref:Arf-GAP domain-containing protein n=1 Tax=Perilla frutescens var. hirtella TaxID=608512 RepID=A0AAD4JMT5_PERFH|nr:hypothetical protein C2S53_012557 [Perilla frutescens var. hirtella]